MYRRCNNVNFSVMAFICSTGKGDYMKLIKVNFQTRQVESVEDLGPDEDCNIPDCETCQPETYPNGTPKTEPRYCVGQDDTTKEFFVFDRETDNSNHFGPDRTVVENLVNFYNRPNVGKLFETEPRKAAAFEIVEKYFIKKTKV